MASSVSPHDSSTREAAQRRVEQIRAFRAEVEALQSESALRLSTEQSEVLARYHDTLLADLARRFDVDRTATERQMSLGMRVASLVGAIALSAAIFLFFYRFWGLLAVPVQVALLVAAPLVAIAGVELAARREKTLYIASLFALVAFASFVLDLSVLATIFNMPPSVGGFLAWGLFALLVAYAYRLRVLLFIGICCLSIWLGGVLISLTGAWWDGLLLRPENFVVAGLAALGAGHLEARRGSASLAQVYRAVGWLAVLVPLLFLSEFGEISYLPLPAVVNRHLYDVVGFVTGVAAVWLAIRRGWNETLNTGGLFVVVFLCLKIYDWCWDLVPRYVFFLLIGAVSIGLIVALQRLRARQAGNTVQGGRQ